MSVQQWAIVIGVMGPVILAMLTWMFRASRKLTEVSTQMAGVKEDIKAIKTTLGRLFELDRDRLPQCMEHEAQLKDLKRRIDTLGHVE